MMHIIYTQVRACHLLVALVKLNHSRFWKKKRGASGSTSMATTPPVGCPLSASPAAQSTPDPGPPSDAAAQGTPAPGPPSSPAAQSKPSTQDGGPPSGSREFICSCFIFLNFSIIDLYHSTLLCLVNYNKCIFREHYPNVCPFCLQERHEETK